MKTAKQRHAARDAQLCEQYRKANWDGCEANNYFARSYRPDVESSYMNKPKHEAFERLKEVDIARNELFLEIAPLSFEKEKIVSYLSHLVPEKVFVQENIIRKEEYVNAYITAAKEILENIQKQHYDFQK
ncbi:hypothetical protein [Chitinophaga sp. MM2321]|uniref:hypothetical protein n=1 Tax=Chitinophaga sp. MM2321 TaxID=3137178 RepID=UPI0032D58D35